LSINCSYLLQRLLLWTIAFAKYRFPRARTIPRHVLSYRDAYHLRYQRGKHYKNRHLAKSH